MDKDFLSAAIRIIIALPLVTALAYFLIKYGLARRAVFPGGKRCMRLVEQIPIGPKTTISLVEVGGSYILLAHSDNGFYVIREMDQLPEPVSVQSQEMVDIKEILDNLKQSAGRNELIGRLLSWKGRTK
ncbi:MAG: flagellar biosynthetic protein FliO [Bacillota bacterium]